MSYLRSISTKTGPILRQQQSRLASTTSSTPLLSRFRSGLISTVFVLGTATFLVYSHDSRAGVHNYIFLPALGLITANDPEKAHEIAVKAIGSGFGPVDMGTDSERMAFELWGRRYSNPLGMAAGFDKHGEAIDGLFNLGFSYVEIGSVTPEPQPGNPKPRVFRLKDTESLINRYGFNSEGHSTVVSRLRSRIRNFVNKNALLLPQSLFPQPPRDAAPNHDVVAQLLASPFGTEAQPIDSVGLPRSLKEGSVLAINLGKNKTSPPESHADFVKGVHALGPYADILVVNVSSPNTPGLRSLQRKDILSELLTSVVAARDSLRRDSNYLPPILVKIAPDLTKQEIKDIAESVLESKIDGIIISNTTITRPASAAVPSDSTTLLEAGGLSGPPVKPLALACISEMYVQTQGKVVLIGCGGISSGQDAIDFAKAGATMVQLYTGFIYGGVGLPRKIKDEVGEILEKEGKNWVDLIGSGVSLLPKIEDVVVAEKEEVKEVILPAEGGQLILAKEEMENLVKEIEAMAHSDIPSIPTPSPSPIMELLDAQDIANLLNPTPVPTPAADAPIPAPAPTPSEVVPLPTPTTAAPTPEPIPTIAVEEILPASIPSSVSAVEPTVVTIAPTAIIVVAAPVAEVVKSIEESTPVKEKVEIKIEPLVRGGGKRWV